MVRYSIHLFIVCALILVSSTAIAAKQRGFPSVDIPAGKAAVHVYREKKLVGAAVKHRLFVDQATLLPIGNGDCSVVFVDPGKIVIDVEAGGVAGLIFVVTERLLFDPFRILSLDVDPGKSYFLRFALNEPDSLAPKPLGHSLYLVTESEARKATKKCEYRAPVEVVIEDAST